MTIFEQKDRAQQSLNYILSVLNAGGLAAWEAKEYSTLAAEREEEIVRLTKLIEEYNEAAL